MTPSGSLPSPRNPNHSAEIALRQLAVLLNGYTDQQKEIKNVNLEQNPRPIRTAKAHQRKHRVQNASLPVVRESGDPVLG